MRLPALIAREPQHGCAARGRRLRRNGYRPAALLARQTAPACFSVAAYFLPQPGHSTVMGMEITSPRHGDVRLTGADDSDMRVVWIQDRFRRSGAISRGAATPSSPRAAVDQDVNPGRVVLQDRAPAGGPAGRKRCRMPYSHSIFRRHQITRTAMPPRPSAGARRRSGARARRPGRPRLGGSVASAARGDAEAPGYAVPRDGAGRRQGDRG